MIIISVFCFVLVVLLLLVYEVETSDEAYMIREYTFEIWGQKENKIVKLDEGELFGTDGGVKIVRLTEYNGQTYLVTGSTDSFCFNYYHGYIDGKMEIVREALWEDTISGELICSINGNPISYEQWEQEEAQWLANEQSYCLMRECEEILQIVNDTKEQLETYHAFESK